MSTLKIDFMNEKGAPAGAEVHVLPDSASDQQAQLAALRKIFGFETDRDVVSAAVHVLMLATRNPGKGHKIAVIDEQNHPVAVCTLDQPKR
jgi:hypothetical protein